jgi:hypothetical protein
MRAEFVEDDYSQDDNTIEISNTGDWFSFKKEKSMTTHLK